MSKLTTPVQYEPSLGGLNVLRPLQLADDDKITLSLPVLCVNPVDKSRPATGKLLRSSGAGCLLKSNCVKYDNYEVIATAFHADNPKRTIIFHQKVFQVFGRTHSHSGYTSVWWTNSTYTQYYMSINFNKTSMLPFVGQVMYFDSGIVDDDWAVIELYGFY